jgi:hypothetical protein
MNLLKYLKFVRNSLLLNPLPLSLEAGLPAQTGKFIPGNREGKSNRNFTPDFVKTFTAPGGE